MPEVYTIESTNLYIKFVHCCPSLGVSGGVQRRAKPRANDRSYQATSSHMQLRPVRPGGPPGHVRRRARTLPGITREIYALLTVYQALRIAIADTTITVPGTDPDRASFSVALHAARDQVIQAAGVIASETIDLAGTIGRHILDNLLPARRLRVSPAPSSARCRATPTKACAWTGAPTRQRSASTS
jgi:hypothetical protein